MSTRLPGLVVLVLAGASFSLERAHATVPDRYGFGARAMGWGGGGVASADDGFAASVNPAGLTRLSSPHLALGASATLPRFAEVPPLWWDTNRDGLVDERDAPLAYSAAVDDLVGFHFQASRPLGDRLGIGVAAFLPADKLVRFTAFDPRLPSWFMYDNRPQRYVATIGMGARLFRGVSLGAGIDLMPSGHLRVAFTADAALTGDQGNDEDDELEDLVGDVALSVHDVSFEVFPDYAPVLGLQVDVGELVPALHGLWMGASWRGAAGLPITVELDMQANVAITDVGDLEPVVTAAVLDAGLALFDHYIPATLGLGAAWDRSDRYRVHFDARWTEWRGMMLNVATVEHVDVHSPLIDLGDFVVDGSPHDVELRSVWSTRMGTEVQIASPKLQGAMEELTFTTRAGVSWEPTPLVSQGDATALLDTDKLGFSIGAGLETRDPFQLTDGPVRLDLFAQHHFLIPGELPRHTDRPRAGFPVEASAIPFGGRVHVFGGQIGFDH